MTRPRWVTAAVAADHFCVSRSKVYALIASGALPAERFRGSRAWLIDLDAAESALLASSNDGEERR